MDAEAAIALGNAIKAGLSDLGWAIVFAAFIRGVMNK